MNIFQRLGLDSYSHASIYDLPTNILNRELGQLVGRFIPHQEGNRRGGATPYLRTVDRNSKRVMSSSQPIDSALAQR